MQWVYKIISDQVSLKELFSVSYTTDNWTSRANAPFMSLSLHYINNDWDLQNWCMRVGLGGYLLLSNVEEILPPILMGIHWFIPNANKLITLTVSQIHLPLQYQML